MPSSTLSDDNILARRSVLALLNLQATPMVPGVNLANSNPQRPANHVTNTRTRHLFPAWPEGSVIKTKTGLVQNNVLKFKCRQDDQYFLATVDTPENAAFGAGIGIASPIFSASNWSNGDDCAYTNCIIYVNKDLGMIDHDNDPNTPAQQAWEVLIFQCELIGSYLIFTSDTYIGQSTIEYTTPNSIVDTSSLTGGFTSAYITYSGKIEYKDVMEAATYPLNSDFSARSASDSAHGLSEYIITDGRTLSNSDGTFYAFTYVLSDTDVPYGNPQRYLAKGKWEYTPATGLCGTCPFAGKTITIEAKFKQATVTRSPDTEGVCQTMSLGTWSDHSTQTFTLTLPDSMSAQELGSEFDFPTSPGKVIALDDLKVVSVA